MSYSMTESKTYTDGTYAITPESITDYGVRWGYGYMVGVETIVAANIGRYPTGHELRTIAGLGLVGVWKDIQGGRVYVDKVRHIGTREEAMTLAKSLGEIAIWDLRGQCEIRVS